MWISMANMLGRASRCGCVIAAGLLVCSLAEAAPTERTPVANPAPDPNPAPAVPSPHASVPVDVVVDGSFEAGTPNPNWTEASTNFGTPICDAASCGETMENLAHTGSWWAWFGGIADIYEAGSLEQNLQIPVGSATLSFYLEMETCGEPADYLDVLIDGNVVFHVDATSASCGATSYSQQSVDVGAYADGGTHTLTFYSETNQSAAMGTPSRENMGLYSTIFVDDVSLVVTTAVPTLNQAGLAMLAVLLGGLGLWRLRRRGID
jgi:hypothetical protein